MAESDAQKGAEVRRELTQAHRKSLYQAARFLNLDTRCRIGQRVPCEIYVQDREEGAVDKKIGKQVVDLRWEPLLADGPTNARFAVVDYDGDTGILQPPAHWNEEAFAFQVADGREITEETTPHQFRQVNAWATAQRVLEYYEDPRQLGRPIPWGFEGNRLMIVPQAGFQNNAYYDRNSKSLQLYYFGDPEKPRYACLSHDIVAHETGHAVLDGIRPYFLENSSWETAAFHEFVGDLTAILLAFRNNDVRSYLEEKFGTHLELADFLAGVAGEFGKYVENRKFLRSALNSVSFADAQQERSAHFGSQVLSGAMFEILVGVACQYLSPERQAERKKPATPAGALWWAANRMGGLALQPLDLLPPVDVGTSALNADPARTDVWAQAPPSAIASHHMTTDAAIEAFDLFNLSSFSIQTMAPQRPIYVPILARIPIIGPMFQFSRSPKVTRHESLILANTVILPRSVELQRFYSEDTVSPLAAQAREASDAPK